MRCLFTTVFSLLGLLLLLVGGFLLYTSFIDSPDTRVDTLGGASKTQQQVALENSGASSPDLLVVRDGQSSTTNIQGEAALDAETSVTLTDPRAVGPDTDRGFDAELTQEVNAQAAEATTSFTDIGSNVILKNQVLTADTEVQVFSLNTPQGGNSDGGLSPDGQGGAAAGSDVEQRVVEFEWPEVFRSGEAGLIRVTLKALPNGQIQVSSPEIPTNALIATPILLTDCYAGYDATVTGRVVVDKDSFSVDSSATTATQVLRRGSDVTWRWTLEPLKDGVSIITVALRIQWTLRPGATPSSACDSLAQTEFTFWGQSVQVEINKVFGLITIPQASIAGTVLAVIGAVSQLPFAGEVFSVLFERNLEQRAERRRDKKSHK